MIEVLVLNIVRRYRRRIDDQKVQTNQTVTAQSGPCALSHTDAHAASHGSRSGSYGGGEGGCG